MNAFLKGNNDPSPAIYIGTIKSRDMMLCYKTKLDSSLISHFCFSGINMSSCFICDEKVANDKVHLATGIAPHSKLGLPAKISNLIGDDFVVVVTQSDHVCRRCSALINHMDKLETELSYVKKAITGYIRTKYNLPFDEESKVRMFIFKKTGYNS